MTVACTANTSQSHHDNPGDPLEVQHTRFTVPTHLQTKLGFKTRMKSPVARSPPSHAADIRTGAPRKGKVPWGGAAYTAPCTGWDAVDSSHHTPTHPPRTHTRGHTPTRSHRCAQPGGRDTAHAHRGSRRVVQIKEAKIGKRRGKRESEKERLRQRVARATNKRNLFMQADNQPPGTR